MKCDLNTYATQLKDTPDVRKKFHVSIPRDARSRALICRVFTNAYIRHCDGLHHGLRALGRAFDRRKKRTLEGQHVASIRACSFREHHQACTALKPLLESMHVRPRHSTCAFDKFRPLKAGQNTHSRPKGNFSLRDK